MQCNRVKKGDSHLSLRLRVKSFQVNLSQLLPQFSPPVSFRGGFFLFSGGLFLFVVYADNFPVREAGGDNDPDDAE